jgi:hypothetical protein
MYKWFRSLIASLCSTLRVGANLNCFFVVTDCREKIRILEENVALLLCVFNRFISHLFKDLLRIAIGLYFVFCFEACLRMGFLPNGSVLKNSFPKRIDP